MSFATTKQPSKRQHPSMVSSPEATNVDQQMSSFLERLDSQRGDKYHLFFRKTTKEDISQEEEAFVTNGAIEVSKQEPDGKETPASKDWSWLAIKEEDTNLDICKSVAPDDEKFDGYRGIYQRMGLKEINYPLGNVKRGQLVNNIDWHHLVNNDDIFQAIMNPPTAPEFTSVTNITPITASRKESDTGMDLLELLTPAELMEYETQLELDKDQEYQEQKANWPKDQPNFKFFDLFEKLSVEKKERRKVLAQLGLERQDIMNFKNLIKASQGEIIDDGEEELLLKKIQYRKGLGIESLSVDINEHHERQN